ncbi:MbtH family NRPS accessory protein [Dactylosporangium sp. CA-139114]|uniref:MbtH family NRPS accessory protein n=1 Tax=Dactylosporangium sp. CA-139114 TaxID=3239931 RepID=UPI003D952569
MQTETTTPAAWLVVRNAAGRHSIWPAHQPVPPGWEALGPERDRAGCLAWIAEHWIDARPAGVGRTPA